MSDRYKDSLLEAIEHVRSLTHIIGPHWEGNVDLRSEYKMLNNWLSDIACAHPELKIVGGWQQEREP